MKLTVSTETQSFSVDLPDAECEARFQKLARILMSADGIPDEVKTPTLTPAARPRQTAVDAIRRAVPGPYTGFMYIECPSCGERRGFNAKAEMNNYHCVACRSTCELPPALTPLYVVCECGRRFRYLTNIDDMMFDITCLSCGSPVAIMFNNNTGVFESVGQSWRKGKRNEH